MYKREREGGIDVFVCIGITNVDGSMTLTYADDMGILDMSTWTWITTLPPLLPNPPPPHPGCRFDMRVSQATNGNNDGATNGLPYDSTVISNPNSNDDTSLKEGLGIGLGLFVMLLCGGGVFLRWWRNDAKIFNPRWLPASSTTLPSSKELDTKNDVPMLVISTHP